MRIVTAVTALMLGCGCAAGAPLTCETFKTRLVEAIHAGGDEVATPKDFKVIRKDEIPRILYGFDGIVGVTGTLDCALDDAFRHFGFKTTLDVRSDVAAALGLTRSKALFGAAICATDPTAITDCDARAFGLVETVVASMAAAGRRGEPYPGGQAQRDVSPDTRVSVTALPGELLFTIEHIDRDPD